MIPICTTIRPDFKQVEEHLGKSFETSQMSNFGPCYEKLCDELSVFLDLPSDKRIVLTSSGHTALMAAYYRATMNIVYVYGPAYTFPSTWLAIPEGVDYIPYDDDMSWIYLMEDVFSSVAPLSVIPDLEKVQEIKNLYGNPVVIDGAATFGTPGIYGYGDYYCLSFHATKTFSLGEGGAVICDKSEEPYIRRYINFGIGKNKQILDIPSINGKLSEYTCAIGLSILPKMKEVIDRRLENACIYKEKLGDLTPRSWIEDTVYQVFPIYLPSATAAKKVRKALDKEEIQHLKYYRPGFSLPGAERKYKTNVCLPVHQDIDPNTISRICDIVLSV